MWTQRFAAHPLSRDWPQSADALVQVVDVGSYESGLVGNVSARPDESLQCPAEYDGQQKGDGKLDYESEHGEGLTSTSKCVIRSRDSTPDSM
jgi:hypothetical protein